MEGGGNVNNLEEVFSIKKTIVNVKCEIFQLYL